MRETAIKCNFAYCTSHKPVTALDGKRLFIWKETMTNGVVLQINIGQIIPTKYKLKTIFRVQRKQNIFEVELTRNKLHSLLVSLMSLVFPFWRIWKIAKQEKSCEGECTSTSNSRTRSYCHPEWPCISCIAAIFKNIGIITDKSKDFLRRSCRR